MTPHIESKKNEISKNVLMPGDPLRGKYIAENFLSDVKIINTVRNMIGYTGFYNDIPITIFPSGMGMPSMGIYCYELYKFYDVDNIIRIGSCGAYSKNINLFDTILVKNSYTESNFSHSFNGKECHIIQSSNYLNQLIKQTAKNQNIDLLESNIICNEVFDSYMTNFEKFFKHLPENLNIQAAEMESFALFYIAKHLKKEASCLLTVSDNLITKEQIQSDKRENSLNTMIKLALDSITNKK